MTARTLDTVLKQITGIDKEECSRLLAAYLELKNPQDREMVVQLAETLRDRSANHRPH